MRGSALDSATARRPTAARTSIVEAGGSQLVSGAGLMDPDGTNDVASLYEQMNTGSSKRDLLNPSSSETARHDVTCDC